MYYYILYLLCPWVLYSRAIKLLGNYQIGIGYVNIQRALTGMGKSRYRILVLEEKYAELLHKMFLEMKSDGHCPDTSGKVIQFRDPTKPSEVGGGTK